MTTKRKKAIRAYKDAKQMHSAHVFIHYSSSMRLQAHRNKGYKETKSDRKVRRAIWKHCKSKHPSVFHPLDKEVST